ncbi:SDR family NAD(P)-dependent oxidoreductase [Spirillospora sp. CA-294931]|uniref:SDR family NAD(P)-dependent oxidoreductase n=1 Tax=Spirillospora sp. CA-294931 TaxID=3240042 RepID=UPI003D8DEC9E
MTLQDKVALVTGGSRGIGAATARALADAGADVAISFVASSGLAEDVVRDIKDKGRRAVALRADQADRTQSATLVDSVVREFGRLDILVNNAGIMARGQVGDPESSSEDLDRMFAVNVDGVVATTRAAAQVMEQDGRIIMLGSNLASRSMFPGVADYAATKAALVGYAKGAARDLGPRRITVNVLQSGSCDTDMNPADGPSADRQRATNALNRYGRPEEIAAGVLFLAQPTSSFITGSVLTIDGGAIA